MDKQYLMNYSKHFTWDEFVSVNLEACEYLRVKAEDKDEHPHSHSRAS